MIGCYGYPCFASGCSNLIIRETLSNVRVLRFEGLCFACRRAKKPCHVSRLAEIFCLLRSLCVAEPQIDEELIDLASCRVYGVLHRVEELLWGLLQKPDCNKGPLRRSVAVHR